MIDLWLVYVYLEICPFQGTSTWILETKTRWARVISFCGVPVRCGNQKKIGWLVDPCRGEFALPSIAFQGDAADSRRCWSFARLGDSKWFGVFAFRQVHVFISNWIFIYSTHIRIVCLHIIYIYIYTHTYIHVRTQHSIIICPDTCLGSNTMPYQGLLWFRKRYRYQKIHDDRYAKSFHYDQTPTSVLVKDHLLPGCIIFLVYIMEIIYRSKVSKFQLRCFCSSCWDFAIEQFVRSLPFLP